MGFFNKLFRKREPDSPQERIIVNPDSIVVRTTGGEAETLAWSDVDQIEIVTTDEGPAKCDVFLVLTSGDKALSVPQDSPAYQEVYDLVTQWEGFDFRQVIHAMGSAENARFLVWERQK